MFLVVLHYDKGLCSRHERWSDRGGQQLVVRFAWTRIGPRVADCERLTTLHQWVGPLVLSLQVLQDALQFALRQIQTFSGRTLERGRGTYDISVLKPSPSWHSWWLRARIWVSFDGCEIRCMSCLTFLPSLGIVGWSSIGSSGRSLSIYRILVRAASGIFPIYKILEGAVGYHHEWGTDMRTYLHLIPCRNMWGSVLTFVVLKHLLLETFRSMPYRLRNHWLGSW